MKKKFSCVVSTHDSVIRTNCERIMQIGYVEAKNMGLNADQSEDCSVTLLEKLLDNEGCKLRYNDHGVVIDAWIRICAINNAIDYQRHLSSINIHETAREEESNDRNSCAYPDTSESNPQHSILMVEINNILKEHICRLSPSQQILFTDRYLQGLSINDISLATGRSGNAIRTALNAIRRHLRQSLIRAGFTEFSLREYLVP